MWISYVVEVCCGSSMEIQMKELIESVLAAEEWRNSKKEIYEK